MSENNQDIINKCLKILRKLNHDEFSSSISNDNNLESIHQELTHLENTIQADRALREKIINHLTENMSGNIFNKFPENEFEYEFQILTQIINTFIEELEGNTIHLNNLQQLLIDLPVKFLVISKEGFVIFQSRNEFKLRFSKKQPIHLYDHITEIFEQNIIKHISEFNNCDRLKNSFEITQSDDEKQLFYELNLKKVDFSGQENILLSIRNTTKTKTEEIRALKERIKGQDQERKRLATDLHDSMGQELNVIKMYVQSLSKIDRNTSVYKENLQELFTTIDQTIHSIREISFNLMPFILENNTLTDAITQFFNKLKKQRLFDISLLIEKNLTISMDKYNQLFVYRIIQEFTTNAIKHSKGTTLVVQITRVNQNQVKIKLQDNGIGFSLNSLSYGNGIRNIKERLIILNSEHTFESTNKGTSLSFILNG